MSSQHFEKITCPQCQKDSEFVMYDSVNVSLDPEDKEKIIDGSLFLFKCPECDAEVHVEYGVLYHDMDKQLMIQNCSNPESAANAPAINEPMKKLADSLPNKEQLQYVDAMWFLPMFEEDK